MNSSNSRVESDLTTPERAHDTLVRAIKAEDLTTFIDTLEPSVFRRMVGGKSPYSVDGQRLGRKIMNKLRETFLAVGFPELGEEIIGGDKERVFRYEDRSNPENQRATYRREGSRWMLAD